MKEFELTGRVLKGKALPVLLLLCSTYNPCFFISPLVTVGLELWEGGAEVSTPQEKVKHRWSFSQQSYHTACIQLSRESRIPSI